LPSRPGASASRKSSKKTRVNEQSGCSER
jgi:hypothetical protein